MAQESTAPKERVNITYKPATGDAADQPGQGCRRQPVGPARGGHASLGARRGQRVAQACCATEHEPFESAGHRGQIAAEQPFQRPQAQQMSDGGDHPPTQRPAENQRRTASRANQGLGHGQAASDTCSAQSPDE